MIRQLFLNQNKQIFLFYKTFVYFDLKRTKFASKVVLLAQIVKYLF